DVNHDGRIDFIGHDYDRDGLVDDAEFDTNRDGVLDTRMYDDTGDGWMDRRGRSPRSRRSCLWRQGLPHAHVFGARACQAPMSSARELAERPCLLWSLLAPVRGAGRSGRTGCPGPARCRGTPRTLSPRRGSSSRPASPPGTARRPARTPGT